MIARGKNASDLFPAVVKNVACKNIEVSVEQDRIRETGSDSWAYRKSAFLGVIKSNLRWQRRKKVIKSQRPLDTRDDVCDIICVCVFRWRSWCMCISCVTPRNSRILLCCPSLPSKEAWRFETNTRNWFFIWYNWIKTNAHTHTSIKRENVSLCPLVSDEGNTHHTLYCDWVPKNKIKINKSINLFKKYFIYFLT